MVKGSCNMYFPVGFVSDHIFLIQNRGGKSGRPWVGGQLNKYGGSVSCDLN